MDKATKLVLQTKLRTYVASSVVTLTSTETGNLIGWMIKGKAESFDENFSASMIKRAISVKLVNKLIVYSKLSAQTRETMKLHRVETAVEVQNGH